MRVTAVKIVIISWHKFKKKGRAESAPPGVKFSMRGKEDQGVGIIHGGKLCTPLHLHSHLLKHNDHLHLVKYPLKLDTMQLIQAQRGHSVGNRKVRIGLGRCTTGTIPSVKRHILRRWFTCRVQPLGDTFAGKEIDLIISDVDGTLLNPNQELTEGVKHAVKTAALAGVPLVIATGKAIGPWTHRILPQLDTSMPQVFLQGLLVRDACGTIIKQRLLDSDILSDAIDFASHHSLTLTAYCGDRVVCSHTNEHTDRLIFYGEPTPEGIGSLKHQIGAIPIMKVLLMDSEERIQEIRPQAQSSFAGRAALTTAIPGMLEILPLGASKGAGVEWLLNQLAIPPSRCLAIGDGENDIEMLQLCGVGVAMGNAANNVKNCADAVVKSNAEDGVAEAISRYVLHPRGLSLPPLPASLA